MPNGHEIDIMEPDMNKLKRVTINSKTEIWIPKNKDAEEAKSRFINKMEKYSDMVMKSRKPE